MKGHHIWSRRDGSDEGSPHMVSMRNKKINYHQKDPFLARLIHPVNRKSKKVVSVLTMFRF